MKILEKEKLRQAKMNDYTDYEAETMVHITTLLRRLGMYRNYKGYNCLAYAVYLVLKKTADWKQ